MSFFSDLLEGMFFRSDSIKYWSAALYGLQSVKGYIQNNEALGKGETVAYEILKPKSGCVDPELNGAYVFFFHSAQFNMSYNMQQAAFLALSGIPVVLFDYRGVGESYGSLSLKGMSVDANLVFNELTQYDFLNPQRTILMGQGVGADASLRFYLEHSDACIALILESVYSTQKGWIKERYGPVVGDFCAYLFNQEGIQPIDVVSQIQCPHVVIRPGKDDFARKGQSDEFDSLLGEAGDVWEVKGKRYLGVLSDNASPVRKQLIDWIKSNCKDTAGELNAK